MEMKKNSDGKVSKWDFEDEFFNQDFRDNLFEYAYRELEMTDEEKVDNFNRAYGNSYTTMMRDILNHQVTI